MDVVFEDMQPLRKMQLRLPTSTTQNLVDEPVGHMQTNNLFYMLNKYTPEGKPRIVLLAMQSDEIALPLMHVSSGVAGI